MTPPRAEFMAKLAAEGQRRTRERCQKRKAARQEYMNYRAERARAPMAQCQGRKYQ